MVSPIQVDAQGSAPRLRVYESWTEPDYEQLVTGLCEQVPLAEIAIRLGRTQRGTEKRLEYLVPDDLDPEERVLPGMVESWLRERLDSWLPRWRESVRARIAEDGQYFWSREELLALRAGWQRATAMPKLAERLRTSEVAIARQVIAQRWADTREQVVARLGATPGGGLDQSVRLAGDDRLYGEWLLTITDPDRPWLSRHGTREGAELERDALLARYQRDNPSRTVVLSWVIAHRNIDQANTGQTIQGSAVLPATTTPAAALAKTRRPPRRTR